MDLSAELNLVIITNRFALVFELMGAVVGKRYLNLVFIVSFEIAGGGCFGRFLAKIIKKGPPI